MNGEVRNIVQEELVGAFKDGGSFIAKEILNLINTCDGKLNATETINYVKEYCEKILMGDKV